MGKLSAVETLQDIMIGSSVQMGMMPLGDGVDVGFGVCRKSENAWVPMFAVSINGFVTRVITGDPVRSARDCLAVFRSTAGSLLALADHDVIKRDLVSRGLLDENGEITELGRKGREFLNGKPGSCA